MDSGDNVSCRFIMITNVPLWWEMTLVGEAVHVGEQGIHGKFLYLFLHFAVNLQVLYRT